MWLNLLVDDSQCGNITKLEKKKKKKKIQKKIKKKKKKIMDPRISKETLRKVKRNMK